jgi:hypothetical protein
MFSINVNSIISNVDYNIKVKDQKTIAVYNSLPFHYELMGFVIYYCKLKNIRLYLYCLLDRSNGYIDFYKGYFNYGTYKSVDEFYNNKSIFDKIVLITDDDPGYLKFKNDFNLFDKTLSLECWREIRITLFKNHVATRNFKDGREWVLPIFKLDIDKINHEEMNIFIFTSSVSYNTNVLNRLKSNKKIVIHTGTRQPNVESFKNISESVKVIIYPNLNFLNALELIKYVDFGITDICNMRDHVHSNLSGILIFLLSTLTPVLFDKDSNEYYNFKSAFTFDKNSKDNIDLDSYIYNKKILEEDRDNNIKHTHDILSNFI